MTSAGEGIASTNPPKRPNPLRRFFRARPFPPLFDVTEGQIERATPATLGKIVWNSVARIFHDRVGIILFSTFVLILLWGRHGEFQLLDPLGDWWRPSDENPADRAQIIPGIPWDQEWISFLIGFVVLVLIPCAIIKFGFKQPLSDFGLGMPPPERRRFAVMAAVIIFVVSLVAFLTSTDSPAMQAEYPLYRGDLSTAEKFIVYELGYLVFFIVIEFTFRGFLLFGLYRAQDVESREKIGGTPGPLIFGSYAVLIAMLSYTAWHIGKPIDEAWGTIVWGVVAGTVVLESRSILPIIIVHWLLNVCLDLAILEGWSIG